MRTSHLISAVKQVENNSGSVLKNKNKGLFKLGATCPCASGVLCAHSWGRQVTHRIVLLWWHCGFSALREASSHLLGVASQGRESAPTVASLPLLMRMLI